MVMVMEAGVSHYYSPREHNSYSHCNHPEFEFLLSTRGLKVRDGILSNAAGLSGYSRDL